MRHGNKNVKLSKATDQRMALLRSLVQALFINGKIKTTIKRAKQACRMANSLITLSRTEGLMAKKKIYETIRDEKALKKLFELKPERFEGKVGGFTRIIRIGTRKGDAAQLVVLEII